jgi:methylase of polypeptide subunit release factors
MTAPAPTPPVAPPRRPASAHPAALPSLADAAPWLSWFEPPFAFGSFFAPEDTVLCALATRDALARTPDARRVVELTSGSTLVLATQLLADPGLRGAGAEVDAEAVARARRNLAALGLAGRASVRRIGLFSPRLAGWLRRDRPDVLACNPPYVPEPPDAPLALVAGAGPRGDRHPRRTLRVAAEAGIERVVLSWCSLGDPVAVLRTGVRAGYRLERLWVAAIADGDYTGGAHAYLRTLPTAFLAEQPATLAALGEDGAVRFAYLLLAGSFVRDRSRDQPARGRRALRRLTRLTDAFRADGLGALERAHMAGWPGLRAFRCDRWDELAMRVTAHGP